MMPPLLQAPKAGQKVDIEIRYYGEKAGRYMLYDDDGETFNYEKGNYSFREIKVENRQGTISAAVKGKPNTVGNITWKFMTPLSPKGG
jgi:alpha-glucosidase (family GH31 glycosyl hydrolase)